MLVGAALAILAVMALVLVRALRGPTVYDRILAVNMFGTKTVLLLALMAFISGRLDVLDIALAYALINFISVIAVLRFFESDPASGLSDKPSEDADGAA
jgi:multicomponent Na+:H+ antiporter subunit F